MVLCHFPTFNWHYIRYIFSGTLVIYQLHRLAHPKHDTSLLLPYFLLFIFGIWAVVEWLFLPLAIQIAAVGLLFVSLAYSFVLLRFPQIGQLRALRSIPYLKTFIIAGVWSFLTYLILLLPGHWCTTRHFWQFAERFLFVFLITIPFDFRDKTSDEQKNIKTIAHLFSVKKLRLLSYIIAGLLLLICTYLYYKNGAFLGIMLTFYVLCTYFCIKGFRIRSPYYYTGILDGSMIVYSVLILLFY